MKARKKYSIHWEDDIPVSFEVNGVEYASLDDVSDEADRRKLEAMMGTSFAAEFAEMYDVKESPADQRTNGGKVHPHHFLRWCRVDAVDRGHRLGQQYSENRLGGARAL